MATTKKRSAKRAEPGAVAYEDLPPSGQLAHDIVAEYSDLRPSVQRIVEADLSESQRHRALSLFRSSLGSIGDPYRDPRYAIANCGADDSA
jgi:hypothetical protein